MVLVVEDDYNSAVLLGSIVEAIGHHYVHAVTAYDALEMVYNENFSLIIMDLRLPGGMDGWELARRLRTDHITRTIPLLAVSVEAQQDDRQQALESGCDDYIAKPFSVAMMRKYLNDFLTV
ncbi:MAG: response regulator [Aggregatilineales bacterium]